MKNIVLSCFMCRKAQSWLGKDEARYKKYIRLAKNAIADEAKKAKPVARAS